MFLFEISLCTVTQLLYMAIKLPYMGSFDQIENALNKYFLNNLLTRNGNILFFLTIEISKKFLPSVVPL
jgi:hypothetical protein